MRNAEKHMKAFVKDWMNENINLEELDDKIENTLGYVKRFEEPEDGEWKVWAYEFVSGAHGQYAVRIFIKEIASVELSEDVDLDEQTDLFDEVADIVQQEMNKRSKLAGTFTIGYHEADGSIGAYYHERA